MLNSKKLAPLARTLARHTFIALAALGYLTVAVLPPTIAEAAPTCNGRCRDAVITGRSDIDAATGAYRGVGTVELDGKAHKVTWVSVILSAAAAPDGTLTLTGSHHIVSANGNIDFTTTDELTAIPSGSPGNYVFSSYLTVVAGNGRVRSGFLEVQGQFDAVHGHVVIDSSNGALCSK